MLTKSTEPEFVKIKVLDDGTASGHIEGYASVFGNTDLGGDVVEKGAFNKTLKERLKKGMIKFVDSHAVREGTQAVIGVVEDAKEDDYGLMFKARLSATSRAQEIRQKVKEGIIDALSFGYDIVKDDFDPKTGIRRLKELKLYEISAVIWGMNPKALIEAVKGAVPFQDWPIVEDATRAWSGSAASKRFAGWVSDADPAEWKPSDWAKFKRGHLWVDSDAADTLGGYVFPVVDVVDGDPKYIFKAASAALAICRGGRGAGPSSKWWGDREKLETTIARIYKKFGMEFPEKGWEDEEAEEKFLAEVLAAADSMRARNFVASVETYAKSVISTS